MSKTLTERQIRQLIRKSMIIAEATPPPPPGLLSPTVGPSSPPGGGPGSANIEDPKDYYDRLSTPFVLNLPCPIDGNLANKVPLKVTDIMKPNGRSTGKTYGIIPDKNILTFVNQYDLVNRLKAADAAGKGDLKNDILLAFAITLKILTNFSSIKASPNPDLGFSPLSPAGYNAQLSPGSSPMQKLNSKILSEISTATFDELVVAGYGMIANTLIDVNVWYPNPYLQWGNALGDSLRAAGGSAIQAGVMTRDPISIILGGVMEGSGIVANAIPIPWARFESWNMGEWIGSGGTANAPAWTLRGFINPGKALYHKIGADELKTKTGLNFTAGNVSRNQFEQNILDHFNEAGANEASSAESALGQIDFWKVIAKYYYIATGGAALVEEIKKHVGEAYDAFEERTGGIDDMFERGADFVTGAGEDTDSLVYENKRLTIKRKIENLLIESTTNRILGQIYTSEMKSASIPTAAGPLKDGYDNFKDSGNDLKNLADGHLMVIKGGGSPVNIPLTSLTKNNRNDNMKEIVGVWAKAYAAAVGAQLSRGDKVKLLPANDLYFYIAYDHDPAFSNPISGNYKKIVNPFDVQDFRMQVGPFIDGAAKGGFMGAMDAILGTRYYFEASQDLINEYPELKSMSLAPPKYNLGIASMMRQVENYVNFYHEKFSTGYSMSVDQRWTSEDDDAWAQLVNDVFNTKKIPGIDSAGVSKEEVSRNWKRASEDLREIGDFPGYTSDVDGVLAFAVDAVNGNNEEGKKKRKEKPRPKSSRGSGRSRAKTVEKPQLPRKSFNDINIKLQGRLGRNRKADVFIPDIKEILASNLKGGQMASDGNVSFVIDSVAGGKDVSFGKGAGFFESPYSVVRAIQNSLRGLRTKGSIAVEIPRGDYS